MAAIAPTSTMPFPHPILAPITGEPNIVSIRALRREIFANAAACHSTRGGGDNGHLGLVMTAASYLVRAGANNAYIAPVHPGAIPVHGDNPTAAQISETNRQFEQAKADHRLHATVGQELRKQIIAAVEPRFFAILSDGDFGLAGITPLALLEHLQTTYGTITPEDIERNRAELSTILTVDDPLEDLWLRLSRCQEFAALANEPIPDPAVIRLTLTVFDQTGVYEHTCLTWREKPAVDQTMANFKLHFAAGNLERRRRLTAQAGGYHGANAANGAGGYHGANAANGQRDPLVVIEGDVFMSYCWSHGLISNCNHNSNNCEHRNNGHVATATILNMQGGCTTIYIPRARPNGE